MHIKFLLKFAQEEAKQANPRALVAEKTVEKMNMALFDQLCELFRNAHAITTKSHQKIIDSKQDSQSNSSSEESESNKELF